MKLRDDQWEKLEPLLVGKPGDPGASGRNNRQFIDAVLFIASRKIKWSSLPPEFGKWTTPYMRFRRWGECGLWRQLAETVSDDPELLCKMQRIAVLSHSYITRAQQKLRRRANKQAHRAMLDEANSTPAQIAGLTQVSADSTLHFVGLVSDCTPCVLPDLPRHAIK